eukprot:GILK01004069.1.p1 GENE.GILK01004069.1~~GILK01004069.1.p1  ORF type:complete len:1167 (+),score=303.07 GILK01004069.1:46-3546(+)
MATSRFRVVLLLALTLSSCAPGHAARILIGTGSGLQNDNEMPPSSVIPAVSFIQTNTIDRAQAGWTIITSEYERQEQQNSHTLKRFLEAALAKCPTLPLGGLEWENVDGESSFWDIFGSHFSRVQKALTKNLNTALQRLDPHFHPENPEAHPVPHRDAPESLSRLMQEVQELRREAVRLTRLLAQCRVEASELRRGRAADEAKKAVQRGKYESLKYEKRRLEAILSIRKRDPADARRLEEVSKKLADRCHEIQSMMEGQASVFTELINSAELEAKQLRNQLSLDQENLAHASAQADRFKALAQERLDLLMSKDSQLGQLTAESIETKKQELKLIREVSALTFSNSKLQDEVFKLTEQLQKSKADLQDCPADASTRCPVTKLPAKSRDSLYQTALTLATAAGAADQLAKRAFANDDELIEEMPVLAASAVQALNERVGRRDKQISSLQSQINSCGRVPHKDTDRVMRVLEQKLKTRDMELRALREELRSTKEGMHTLTEKHLRLEQQSAAENERHEQIVHKLRSELHSSRVLAEERQATITKLTAQVKDLTSQQVERPHTSEMGVGTESVETAHQSTQTDDGSISIDENKSTVSTVMRLLVKEVFARLAALDDSFKDLIGPLPDAEDPKLVDMAFTKLPELMRLVTERYQSLGRQDQWSVQQRTALYSELHDLKAELSSLTMQMHTQREQLDTALADAFDKQQTIDSKSHDVESLQEQLTQVKEQNRLAVASAEQKALQQDEELHKQLTSVTRVNSELIEQITQYQTQVQKLEREIASTIESSDAARQSLASAVGSTLRQIKEMLSKVMNQYSIQPSAVATAGLKHSLKDDLEEAEAEDAGLSPVQLSNQILGDLGWVVSWIQSQEKNRKVLLANHQQEMDRWINRLDAQQKSNGQAVSELVAELDKTVTQLLQRDVSVSKLQVENSRRQEELDRLKVVYRNCKADAEADRALFEYDVKELSSTLDRTLERLRTVESKLTAVGAAASTSAADFRSQIAELTSDLSGKQAYINRMQIDLRTAKELSAGAKEGEESASEVSRVEAERAARNAKSYKDVRFQLHLCQEKMETQEREFSESLLEKQSTIDTLVMENKVQSTKLESQQKMIGRYHQQSLQTLHTIGSAALQIIQCESENGQPPNYDDDAMVERLRSSRRFQSYASQVCPRLQ